MAYKKRWPRPKTYSKPAKVELSPIEENAELPIQYTMIRDTREQAGNGWSFSSKDNELIKGTRIDTVKYGDYTIEGYEKEFTIERKKNVAEFAKNILEARFDRELLALENIKHSFVILEFSMSDVMRYPEGAGFSAQTKRKIRVRPPFILKRLAQYEIQYNTKFIFAGGYGKEMALAIIKEFIACQNS